MILVQDIVDSMAALLDAEGNDYYTFDNDYRNAINLSVGWVASVLTPYIGAKKFVEESLSELTYTRVWQTSKFSRFNIDTTSMPESADVWSIIAIHPKPRVYLHSVSGIVPPFPYYPEISPYVGQEIDNGPIVTINYDTSIPLRPFDSTIRPELAFVSDRVKTAKRLSFEEWSETIANPFIAGYIDDSIKNCDDVIEYAYKNISDYNTTVGGYTLQVPGEIEIKPRLINQLVAMTYVAVPKNITAITDTIPFKGNMLNIIATKALSYIAYKQGDGTNIPTITASDVLTLLTSKV